MRVGWQKKIKTQQRWQCENLKLDFLMSQKFRNLRELKSFEESFLFWNPKNNL